jgi:aromatic ring-opening dioxygenase catalytic subunit (LigB family)
MHFVGCNIFYFERSMALLTLPTMTDKLPSLYIPHGGGPCFFMDDPRGTWSAMAEYLHSIPATLPEKPKAILVVSAHWETDGFTFTGAARPDLVFDYYGFPPHTYDLRYDAPGDPALAARAAQLLSEAGLKASVDQERGWDHGVFIPLKVAFPDAAIPVIEMSLDRSLNPALHSAAGRALSALRDEGVLIIGSGMSFHNMRAYGDPRATDASRQFDQWLSNACTATADIRATQLNDWETAPGGLFSHPREEHLIPLMVAAGASGEQGEKQFGALVMETAISGFTWK